MVGVNAERGALLWPRGRLARQPVTVWLGTDGLNVE